MGARRAEIALFRQFPYGFVSIEFDCPIDKIVWLFYPGDVVNLQGCVKEPN
jgi:hypothetical protein